MKSILAGLLITASATAFAQDTQLVNIPSYCTSIKTLDEMLDKFNELPFAQSKSSREVDKKEVTNQLIVFINPDTRSYTIVEQFSPKHVCILAVGEDFKPVSPEVRDEIIKRREKSRL